MMKKKFFLLAGLTFSLAPLVGYTASVLPVDHQIVYHNRPLIKINGKTLSLVDVIKRMDFQLLKQSPHILEDKELRYQYYATNWRLAFQDLIEQEMILIDAETLKVVVSEGDIREELENSLGNTNLILKLDSVGLSLDEAKKAVESEIIVRQMLWFKAYSKALQQVTPELIKTAYADVYLKESSHPKEQWRYQIVTVKSQDPQEGEKAAKETHALLTKDSNRSLTNIGQILQTIFGDAQPLGVQVTVSNEIVVDKQSISQSHYEILSQLNVNQISEPIYQQLKNSHESAHRIFLLKEHSKQLPKPFDELAPAIKDKLIQLSAEKEKTVYIESLKQRLMISDFEIQEALPKEYEPFALI